MKIGSILPMFVLAACVSTSRPTATAVQPQAGPTTPSTSRPEPSCIAARPTHAERIAERGSILDQYHRQDGVWLSHAPVLVNEEFDFTLAMSMEDGVGAGLAAAKRKQGNQKRAQELSELRLGAALDARLEALCACGRDVYFVLWGRQAKVRMVLEGEGPPRLVDAEGIEGVEGIVQRLGELLAGAECR